jgi:putative flippase GtrA
MQDFIELKVFKFIIAGILNTTVSYVSFSILVFFNVHYMLASILGYVLAVGSSYIVNKKWTFNSDKITSTLLVAKFYLVNLLSLGINLIVLFLMVENLKINVYFSQIIAIGFTMFFNYIFYNKIFSSS